MLKKNCVTSVFGSELASVSLLLVGCVASCPPNELLAVSTPPATPCENAEREDDAVVADVLPARVEPVAELHAAEVPEDVVQPLLVVEADDEAPAASGSS